MNKLITIETMMIFSILCIGIIVISSLKIESETINCHYKCNKFNHETWEYKNSCKCFKDGKIIELDTLINPNK